MGEALAACGRLGMGPPEIAARIGWSRADLQARSARWAALGQGLERARDAGLAWWEARARLWASQGRANASLWGKAMAGRFGEEGYAPAGRGPARREDRAGARREITSRDRVKAVRLLLSAAEAPEGRSRTSE